jgi:hypothetical protein
LATRRKNNLMGAILTSLARKLFIVGVPILDPLKKAKAFN